MADTTGRIPLWIIGIVTSILVIRVFHILFLISFEFGR